MYSIASCTAPRNLQRHQIPLFQESLLVDAWLKSEIHMGYFPIRHAFSGNEKEDATATWHVSQKEHMRLLPIESSRTECLDRKYIYIILERMLRHLRIGHWSEDEFCSDLGSGSA